MRRTGKSITDEKTSEPGTCRTSPALSFTPTQTDGTLAFIQTAIPATSATVTAAAMKKVPRPIVASPDKSARKGARRGICGRMELIKKAPKKSSHGAD
jgi:hypothetical protein